jgi:hypothetical protein
VPSIGTIPDAHLPIAVQPGIPDVEVTPASISANVEEGDSTTASLEVANVGNPTIDWTADDGIGTHPFLELPEDGVWGNSSNFYSLQAGGATGAYGADDFVPDDDMVLREIRAEGFNTGSPTLTLQARATQITFKVYSDAGGLPAGLPESGAAGEVYSCVRNVAAGPGSAGLSFLVADGSIFELDAVEAAADGCAAPPTLIEGTRYWLSVFPTVPGTSAQRRWAWSRGTAEVGLGAQLYSPTGISGYPTGNWASAGRIDVPPNPIGLDSFAFTIRGDVECGAPWLSVSPDGDSLGLAEATDVTVTMDATALAAGTYRGYVCVDTLGTDVDEPEPVVPVTLSVGAVPTAPTAAGLAAPASVEVTGSTLMTVEVTPGTNPASSGIAVRADLTAIGGSATQAFFNDGSNGDVSDTDNIWSYTANVALETAPGNKSLTATVTDAQARTANANIALEVQTPVDPSAVGAAAPSTVSVTQSTVLTVNVTPGAAPASSGLDVTADLTAIGGSATTAFLDDGAGADEVDGDGIYTFEATIPLGTAPGAKSLDVSVADDQNRTASATIALTVATPTAVSGSGSASPSNVLANGDVVLSYTVSPGSNPPSSGVEVSVDLTNIGGGTAVAMLDDGVAPDAQQGDLVFTLATTVGAGTSPGVKTLPVTVADDQNRGFGGAIALNVIEAGDPTAVGVAVPGSAGPGGTATFIVSVTAGTNPDSTGLGVTADLSAIGGSATQAFRDDGDGGDQTAGDNVFTYVATVDGDAQPGAKVLTATATDAQGRTAVASINFTVQGGTTTLLIDGFEDP